MVQVEGGTKLSLILQNVEKIFHTGDGETHAVNNFNIEIKKGQLVTLLGPSGCGKTTTLRMIAGFEVPSSGKISLEENEITNLPPNKRNISMVFQSYALFPHLNVEENISFGLKIKKLNKKEIKAKVKKMINLVGLEGLNKRRPDQLSGGQQQRVAVARALIKEPAIILADEPTANLDSATGAEILDLMKELNEEKEATFIFSTHDPAVMERAKRVINLHDGQISSDERR